MAEKERYEPAPIAQQWRDAVRDFYGSRQAVDPTGRAWTIREADAAHVPGSRGRRALIFDTEGHCFRVWSYPLEWRELTTAELLALGRIVRDD
jgi:hypothetical protein